MPSRLEMSVPIKTNVPGLGKAAKISGRNGVAIWAVVGLAGIFLLYAVNDNGPPEDPHDDDEGLFIKIIKLFKRDP